MSQRKSRALTLHGQIGLPHFQTFVLKPYEKLLGCFNVSHACLFINRYLELRQAHKMPELLPGIQAATSHAGLIWLQMLFQT